MSIFDIFFADNTHPCTLIKTQKQNIENMLKSNLKELLKDPNYIFIFRVAQIVVEHLQNYIKAKFGTYIIDEISSDRVSEFWSEVEMAMVLRRAWNSDEFTSDINQAYQEIAQIWGEFLEVEL